MTIFGEPVHDVTKAESDDARFFGVTTIIGALDKPALVHWAAQETARAACRAVASLAQRIAEDGTEETERWLAGARFRRPAGERTATELGTAVHDACERYALTGERPEVDNEVRPYLDQFDKWAQLWQPEYIAAEMTVYSPTYGYAGTCDMIVKVQGIPLIGDYKTSKKTYDNRGREKGPYPEVALQLAAYRHADWAAAWRPRRVMSAGRRYYLCGPEEIAHRVDIPAVEGGMVLHITPEHCHAYPVQAGEDVFNQFLYVLEAARWSFETSRHVIGSRLIHPNEGGSSAEVQAQ